LIIAKNIEADSKNTSFQIDNTNIKLNILGEFNVYNALVAVCVSLSQNITLKKIKKALEDVKGIDGRIEKIDEGQNFSVMVDYAFEPNAVEKLYETINKFKNKKKIIHVLGSAGGGRDKKRRPILGKLAAENVDIVIITNEDPYDEDPQLIIDQIRIGAETAGKVIDKNLFTIIDRRDAIRRAVSLAGENDVVLITGKGSEQAICVKDGEKIPWDDRKVAREEIKAII